MVKGGGGVLIEIEILKNPGIYFYSGLRNFFSWGVQFEILNPKYNPGIDFYSGFRKTSQGGGEGVGAI